MTLHQSSPLVQACPNSPNPHTARTPKAAVNCELRVTRDNPQPPSGSTHPIVVNCTVITPGEVLCNAFWEREAHVNPQSFRTPANTLRSLFSVAQQPY